MSAKSLYINAVSDELDLGGRWIANWPPGNEVAIGMVGDIEDGGFVQRGHLSDSDRAVPFNKDDHKDRPDGYDWASHGAVEVFAKVKGETSKIIPHVPKASAGIKIQFSKKNSVAVRFDRVMQTRIKSEKQLAKDLIAAWNDNQRMQLGDVVVVAVMDSKSGIAATSASESAEVQATVSANIGSGAIDLGKVKGELGITHESGTDLAMTMPAGNAFAYRAVKLTRGGPLWLEIKVRDVHPGLVEAEPEFEIVEGEPLLTIEEYEKELAASGQTVSR
jgi:hypothetical protein